MRRIEVEPFAERMPSFGLLVVDRSFPSLSRLCGLAEGKEGLSSELFEGQRERSRLKHDDPQVSFKGKQTAYGVSFSGIWSKGQVTNLRLSREPCQKSQKICQSRVRYFLFFFFPVLPFIMGSLFAL